MFNSPWEKRHPELVEKFKRTYQDHDLPIGLVAEEFGIANSTSCHEIALRLGLCARVKKSNRQKPAPLTTLGDLEAEEASLKLRLEEVKRKKADLDVRVDRFGTGYFQVFGLGDNGPIVTTPEQIRVFLDGGGPAKLRDAVGKS